MDVIEIDGAKALTLLREIVKDHEDFVYEFPQPEDHEQVCVYQYEGKPSCLVGQALAKAGVTPKELAEMDIPKGPYSPVSINRVPLPERVHLTEEGREIFSAAQTAQDMRQPWSEALWEAENRATYLRIEA